MAEPSSSMVTPSFRAMPSSFVAEPSSEVGPSWARPSSFVAEPSTSMGDTSAGSSMAALATDTLAPVPVGSMRVIAQLLAVARWHHLRT